MLVKYHVLIGFLASLLIFLLFPQIGWFYTLIIFLASFLIDFDHYLYYAIQKRDWNMQRAYYWNMQRMKWSIKLSEKERNEYKHFIAIFHGVECWILLVLLTFVHRMFLFVLIGVFIHMILDFIDLYFWKVPFYSKTSQVYTHLKNKNKKEYKN